MTKLVDHFRTRRKYSGLGRPDLIWKPGFAVLANPFSGILCHWHTVFIRLTLVGSTLASMLATVMKRSTNLRSLILS